MIAGGVFTSAGSGSASRIARWSGTSWSPLAGGRERSSAGLERVRRRRWTRASCRRRVHLGRRLARGSRGSLGWRRRGLPWETARTMWSGPSAFTTTVAGPLCTPAVVFTIAGGTSANHIARWDGASWACAGGWRRRGCVCPRSLRCGEWPAAAGRRLVLAGRRRGCELRRKLGRGDLASVRTRIERQRLGAPRTLMTGAARRCMPQARSEVWVGRLRAESPSGTAANGQGWKTG